MEADSFFGFDTSLPRDATDEGDIPAQEEEEYDVLNDETFGSAAVEEDWEEDHQQLANVTEAERVERRRQRAREALQRDGSESLEADLHRLHIGRTSGPRDILGSHNSSLGLGMSSSLFQQTPPSHLYGGGDFVGSPSAQPTIWTPAPLDDLRMNSGSNHMLHHQQQHQQHNLMGNGLNSMPDHQRGLNPRMASQVPGIGPPGFSQQGIKTVSELEQEMKVQQQVRQHNQQPLLPLHMSAMTVDDIERELSRPSRNRSSPVSHQHPMGSQCQSSFSQLSHSNHLSNNQSHQYQRPLNNHGNYFNQPPPPLPQQQQQQGQQRSAHGYQPNKPHPSHHFHHQQQQHQHQLQQQRQLQQQQQQLQQQRMHLHHHHHHHQGPPSHHQLETGSGNLGSSSGGGNLGSSTGGSGLNHHQQQQQHNQGYNSNRANSDNRFNNHHDEYTQSRVFSDIFDRRSHDRRSYGQQRGFDQGRSHYNRDNGGNNRLSEERSGGGRVRRDSEAEWEEWHRAREKDEYCGLMTPREKSWLRNIQSMQLQSDNPYQDDYYYVMYSVKQQRKREEEVIEIDGLQLLLPDRGKDGGREYEPPRMENSLGKLQVVSVNAPRKIIDLQVVHLDPTHPTTNLQRDMRRHRHLLLYIEKLYNLIMELDDLARKIRLLPDCPTRDLFTIKSTQLAARLWSSSLPTNEKSVQILSVRKGKTLVARLLVHLKDPQWEKLALIVIANFPLLVKRDIHDQVLTQFWPFFDRLIANANVDRLLVLANAFDVENVSSPKGTLASAINHKLGVSVIMALLVRGEQVWNDMEMQDFWMQFLAAVVTVLHASSTDAKSSPNILNSDPSSNKTNSDSNPLAPLPSVALAAATQKPSHHLNRCRGVDCEQLKLAQEKLASLESSLTVVSSHAGLRNKQT